MNLEFLNQIPNWIYYSLGLIFFSIFIIYNWIISYKNKAQQAWHNIDVQLKRRYDLIPNLVNVVRGYKNYEADLLQKIVEKRNQAYQNMSQKSINKLANDEKELSSFLNNFFALSENYPELKASQNFLELQRQIEDTEDKIEAARAGYNWRVADYNTLIQSFPINIIAKIFGFKDMEMFEIKNDIERNNIKVEYNN